MRVRIYLVIILTGIFATAATSGAEAQQAAGASRQGANASGWTFNIAPYLWLPTVDTSLNYNLPPALDGRLPTALSVGPGAVVSHMNFSTAIVGEAKFGAFSILTDFMYLNLSGTTANIKSVDFAGLPSIPVSRSIQFSTGTRLSATLWTLAGGYTVLQGDWGYLDAIAGFRYLRVNATTDYSLGLTLSGPRGNGATFGGIGGISGSGNLWNGIGGFRGRIQVASTGLFIPYYFDIGAGGSKLTWQIASGLGYQDGWAGVSLTYRYLAFEQRTSAVVQHLSLGGPMIMVNFSF